MILLSSLAIGFVALREQRRRLEALDGLDAALRLMEAELAARSATLPELAAFLAKRSTGSAGRFFHLLSDKCASLGERPFSALWSDCAADALPELGETEGQALRELGAALGRYSLERQTEALRRCRERLCREAETARAAYARDRRLIWGLSAAGGLLLVILLL